MNEIEEGAIEAGTEELSRPLLRGGATAVIGVSVEFFKDHTVISIALFSGGVILLYILVRHHRRARQQAMKNVTPRKALLAPVIEHKF